MAMLNTGLPQLVGALLCDKKKDKSRGVRLQTIVKMGHQDVPCERACAVMEVNSQVQAFHLLGARKCHFPFSILSLLLCPCPDANEDILLIEEFIIKKSKQKGKNKNKMHLSKFSSLCVSATSLLQLTP